MDDSKRPPPAQEAVPPSNNDAALGNPLLPDDWLDLPGNEPSAANATAAVANTPRVDGSQPLLTPVATPPAEVVPSTAPAPAPAHTGPGGAATLPVATAVGQNFAPIRPRPQTTPHLALVEPPKWPRVARRLGVAVGVGIVLLLLAHPMSVGHFFGLSLEAAPNAGAALGEAPAQQEPSPVAQAPAATTEAAPQVVAAPPAAPTRLVALNEENIDAASYKSLRAAVADKALSAGQRQWARARLALFFGDTAARAAWEHDAFSLRPKHSKDAVLLQVADALAVLSANAAPTTQRRRAKKVLRGRLGRSAQGLMAQAYLMPAAANVPAQVLLERAITLQPNGSDAPLLLGMRQLRGPQAQQAALPLVALCRRGDPDTIAQAASALLHAGMLSHLNEAVEPLGNGENIVDAAPAHQGVLHELVLRAQMGRGDVPGALRQAQARDALAPPSLATIIAHSRLLRLYGGEADTLLRDAAKTVPGSTAEAELALERGVAALARGDVEAAQAVLKEPGLGGQQTLLRGLMAAAGGDKAQALASLMALPAPAARLHVALLGGNEGHRGDAELWQMWSTERLGAAAFALGQRRLEAGRFAEAAKLLGEGLWLEPVPSRTMTVLLQRYEAMAQAGDTSEALAGLENLWRGLSKEEAIARLQSDVARRAKAFDVSLARLRLLLRRHPMDRPLTLSLAETLVEAGRSEAAVAALEALGKAAPEGRDAAFLLALGQAYVALDPVKARSLLQASISKGDMARTHVVLGELLASRGKNDDAIAAFRDAVRLRPDDRTARLRLGRLLLQRGAYAETVAQIDMLVAQAPQDREAWELLGDAHREADAYPQAALAYTRALSGDRGRPALLLKLARLQIQELGALRPGVKTLRRLLEQDPKAAEAYFMLGFAQRDLGERKASMASLRAYLKLAPQGEYAAEARQALLP